MSGPATSKRSRTDVKHAIDLLWAHQLRRENALIHEDIQKLHAAVDDISSRVKEDHGTIKKLQTSTTDNFVLLRKIDEDQAGLLVNVENIQETGQNLSELVNFVHSTLQGHQTENRESLAQVRIDLNRLQIGIDELRNKERKDDNVECLLTDLKQDIGQKNQKPLLSLEDENGQHREWLTISQHPDDTGNGIRDNSEPLVAMSLSDQVPKLFPAPLPNEQISPESKPYRFQTPVHATFLPVMNSSNNVTRLSDSTDIDLDENVPTLSYAKNCDRAAGSPESLVMITQETSNEEVGLDKISDLKQTRLHSWERYLAEGRAFIRRVSSQHEHLVINQFVNGIHNKQQRKKCTSWLELHGRAWENVEAFSRLANEPVSQDLKMINPQNLPDENTTVMKSISEKTEKVQNAAEPQSISHHEVHNQNYPRRSQRLCAKASQLETPAFAPRKLRGQGSPSEDIADRLGTQRKHISEKKQRKPAKKVIPQDTLEGRLVELSKETSTNIPRPITRGEKRKSSSAAIHPDRAVGGRGTQDLTPRLVKRKHQVQKHPGDSSSDEGQVDRPVLLTEVQLPTRAEQTTSNKKKRLSLPPPPQFAILPTSDA